MIIGIDASKISLKQKTGIDNTAYQIIFNLKEIDKRNTYYLYSNSSSGSICGDNFYEKIIPFPRFWKKFRLPLALLKDKPDKFLELTGSLPPMTPKKSVVMIHDLAFKYFPEAYSKYELLLQENAIQIALKHAEKIVLTSEANKDDFLRFYKYPNDKIEIINLAYDKDTYKKINVKDSDLPITISSPFFLSVGRLEKRKNTKTLIDAFLTFKKKTNNNFKLIIVGKNGYGSEEIVKEARKYPEDIIVLGYLDDSELAKLYNKATSFIFPSLYEGFGIPVLEAMACQVPVLTSDIPTIKEIVGNAAEYFDPTKPDEIANKMIKISNDEKFRQSLVKKGVEQIKKYSWKKTAEKIHSILEEI